MRYILIILLLYAGQLFGQGLGMGVGITRGHMGTASSATPEFDPNFDNNVIAWWDFADTNVVRDSIGFVTLAKSKVGTETLGAETVVNGGGAGQTDWVDTNADGLADGWTKLTADGTQSIVTGNGFTGNAQRREATSASDQLYIFSTPFTSGKLYNLTFKYRSNRTLTAYFGLGATQTATLPINTGNAKEVTLYGITNNIHLIFLVAASSSGDYYELDEISAKEIGGITCLNQFYPGKLPEWCANGGLLFDGSDDFMVTPAVTMSQPLTIYTAIKQVTWTDNDILIDGVGATAKLYQSAPSAFD